MKVVGDKLAEDTAALVCDSAVFLFTTLVYSTIVTVIQTQQNFFVTI